MTHEIDLDKSLLVTGIEILSRLIVLLLYIIITQNVHPPKGIYDNIGYVLMFGCLLMWIMIPWVRWTRFLR